MMFEAEAMDFPAFASLPKREKSKLQKVWDAFQELSRVTEQKGLLVNQSIAARVLDVSKQRVFELVRMGRLETHEFNGVPLVTENSILAFAKSERKAGRPRKIPTTFGETWKRATRPEK